MYPSSGSDFDYSAFAAGQQFGRSLAALQQYAAANPGLQPQGAPGLSFQTGQQMSTNLQGGLKQAGTALQGMQANYAAGLPLFAVNGPGIEAGAAGTAGTGIGAAALNGAGVEAGTGAAGSLISKL